MPRPLQPPGSSDPGVRPEARVARLHQRDDRADLTARTCRRRGTASAPVARLKEGFGALQAGDYAKAAALFAKLLEENPGMLDVWQLYADACLKLGRDADALAALQTAAKLSPGNPQVLMALSDYYLVAGDYAQARKHAELVGEAGPSIPTRTWRGSPSPRASSTRPNARRARRSSAIRRAGSRT